MSCTDSWKPAARKENVYTFPSPEPLRQNGINENEYMAGLSIWTIKGCQVQ